MSTHAERARLFYGGSAEAAKPAAVSRDPRDAVAKRLYGGYGGALASYFDRRESRLRDDKEALEISRRERKQVEAFAAKRGMPAHELQEVLCVLLEHEARPRSPEAIKQRWERTFEELRLSCGGLESATKVTENFTAVAKQLMEEVPTLADRAGRSGAANDLRVIQALAPYANLPEPPPAAE